jgi:hypothetical protein
MARLPRANVETWLEDCKEPGRRVRLRRCSEDLPRWEVRPGTKRAAVFPPLRLSFAGAHFLLRSVGRIGLAAFAWLVYRMLPKRKAQLEWYRQRDLESGVASDVRNRERPGHSVGPLPPRRLSRLVMGQVVVRRELLNLERDFTERIP